VLKSFSRFFVLEREENIGS